AERGDRVAGGLRRPRQIEQRKHAVLAARQTQRTLAVAARLLFVSEIPGSDRTVERDAGVEAVRGLRQPVVNARQLGITGREAQVAQIVEGARIAFRSASA